MHDRPGVIIVYKIAGENASFGGGLAQRAHIATQNARNAMKVRGNHGGAWQVNNTGTTASVFVAVKTDIPCRFCQRPHILEKSASFRARRRESPLLHRDHLDRIGKAGQRAALMPLMRSK